jgi:hypothetical protein
VSSTSYKTWRSLVHTERGHYNLRVSTLRGLLEVAFAQRRWLTPNSSPSNARFNHDEPNLWSLVSSYKKCHPCELGLKLSFVRSWCRRLQKRLARDITAQPVAMDVWKFLHVGLLLWRCCPFWGARLPLVLWYDTKFLVPRLLNQKAIWGLNETSFTLVLAACRDKASFALFVATCKRDCVRYHFTAGHANTPYRRKDYCHIRLPSDIARSSARSRVLSLLSCVARSSLPLWY